MRKKVVVILAAAITAVFLPAGVAFAGAFTQTVHITQFNDTIPINCTSPTGSIAVNATGNGVEHLTVNGTGDWFTTTFAGNGTVMDNVTGATFQGHVTEWFGAEDNNQNSVLHAIFSFHGTNVADSTQSLSMQAHFDVTTNANGQVTANIFSINCH
jgi:hypothetical protein